MIPAAVIEPEILRITVSVVVLVFLVQPHSCAGAPDRCAEGATAVAVPAPATRSTS
jgi:hypothetical protein